MTRAVHCALPKFWASNLAAWFLTAESTFEVFGVEDDRNRYNLVVSAFDVSTVNEVIDVLSNPPQSDLYGNLKRSVLARLTDSLDKQLDQLFNELELGDKRPSQLLRNMKTFAGNKVTEEVLKVKWLHLLPPQVMRILKVLKTSSLDELSTTADELVDTHPSVFAVDAMGRPLTSPSSTLSDASCSAVSSTNNTLTQEVVRSVKQTSNRSKG